MKKSSIDLSARTHCISYSNSLSNVIVSVTVVMCFAKHFFSSLLPLIEVLTAVRTVVV